MQLYKASRQWANRPIDETFWNIGDAYAESKRLKDSAAIATAPYSSLRFIGQGDALQVTGASGMTAVPTHSATGQLCARAKVPHSLIARQPATLAAENLNWGLAEYRGSDNDKAALLFHRNGGLVLRSATSEVYERLWHCDFLAFLVEHLGTEWRTPPAVPSPARRDDPRIRPCTAIDLEQMEGLTRVKVGDKIGPAGVYMSDHDLFVFVVSKGSLQGPSGALNRFAMFWNNEVGTGSWGMTLGLFDVVCGNHIIWGAQDVREIRVRHVGERSAINGMEQVRVTLREYSDDSVSDTEAKLKRSATFELGATREDVIKAVFDFGRKTRVPELTLANVERAYDRADQVGRYGAPNTPWAIASGLTEISQETSFTDERTALDRAAGKVLEIAF